MAFWKKTTEDDTTKSKDEAESHRAPLSPAKPMPSPSFHYSSASSEAVKEDDTKGKSSKIRSVLGNGTVIKGKLTFDTVVSIDGQLHGEVFSSKELVIGETGRVEAQLEVASLIVRGIVKGPVLAHVRIEIKSGGQLYGAIRTPSLTVDEGGVFDGSCSMSPYDQKQNSSSADEKSAARRAAEENSSVPAAAVVQ